MRARKLFNASRISRGSLALLVALLLITAAVSAQAATKLVIHVNKGFGAVKLGVTDTNAVKAIGKPSKSGKDSEYEGRVVYYKFYGKANKNGEYPLEIYSDTKHKVFMFAINASAYPTDEGTKVGSTEAQLKAKYGKNLKFKAGRVYNHYWLGSKVGTDFFVKAGKVTQIIVRSY
ncbi:MAG TPA: hypothetical protein VGK02_07665 [Candidatus Aquicultor sp.]|jgi:hypothetical protein